MNLISNNMGYFIFEGLVYISVILMVLACIAFILNDILLGFCELFFVKMVFFLEFTCVFALWYSDLFGVMWIPCYIILLGVGLEIYTENWK